MNQETDVLVVPHYVVKVDRLLDKLLKDAFKDTHYDICEVLSELDLVTRDEIKSRDEDGIVTHYYFYMSNEKLQDLMEDNRRT